MEGANHDLLRAFADEFFSAFAHFAGGFVGKRDGSNALGLQAHFNQSRNLLRDDPCFARACTRQNYEPL